MHFNILIHYVEISSGFVNIDMVKDYHSNRERYAAKKTRGLANAVIACDEYLANPDVSDRIFSIILKYSYFPNL